MSLYHDLILDHYKNPRNFGALEKPDVVVLETNASCGDEIEVQLKLKPGTNHQSLITDLKWRGRGCAISMAAASILSEHIRHSPSDIRHVSDRDMVKMLGGEISSARMKCATLALRALQRALHDSTGI